MASSATTATAGEVSESGGSDEQGGRRRGRRGGRGRGERRNEAENSTAASVETSEAVAVPVEVAPMLAPVEAPVIAVAPASEMPVQVAEAAPVVVETITQIAEPVFAPPAVEQSAIEPLAPQAPALEAVAVDVPEVDELPVAPVAVQVAAPVDLDKTLSESGLVLVQTTAAAIVAQPEPPVKLGRPRKQKTVEAAEDISLVMVETQK
jgi:ribonuclease E